MWLSNNISIDENIFKDLTKEEQLAIIRPHVTSDASANKLLSKVPFKSVKKTSKKKKQTEDGMQEM